MVCVLSSFVLKGFDAKQRGEEAGTLQFCSSVRVPVRFFSVFTCVSLSLLFFSFTRSPSPLPSAMRTKDTRISPQVNRNYAHPFIMLVQLTVITRNNPNSAQQRIAMSLQRSRECSHRRREHKQRKLAPWLIGVPAPLSLVPYSPSSPLCPSSSHPLAPLFLLSPLPPTLPLYT